MIRICATGNLLLNLLQISNGYMIINLLLILRIIIGRDFSLFKKLYAKKTVVKPRENDGKKFNKFF